MCISVVVPSYNASKFLLKAIDSVKNQTYLPKEL
ncbi:MAG TPA: glycosyltransferase, partial [Thermodesulfobium narugense]|nr:glycosyltransferase [Thermodesulfobium narugense]